ncbi:Insulinase (Peptidase family M16) [Anatilimnocola aggregata]|uniref:Insulinase (Peptidase family M16) n=1 Tax=Anatilimnocola aggregata TaxID=2528021 RepID=A0A517YLI8_9BACT|nr:pitrilysin family protein [Anatilimnocola aggregata]QDU31084.1 Insulinase (Peptidase family M16) [Anatilimnocola aggregata]
MALEFRKHTLDNGLQIVAECNPDAYSASYAYFVRTGSRDESDEVAGVSHFLEHMVFKGTPTRTSLDVNRELDELSSSSNAFTNEEQTVYYATTLPEDQNKIVALLADIMRPSLRQDDFDTEKQVILKEIAKYEDEPPFNAHEKAMALHFGKHPLGRSVLGTVESIEQLKRDQMLAYFEQRYSPQNIILSAAGNVDFEQLIRTAEKYCGQWKAFPAQRKLEPCVGEEGFAIFEKSTAAQQYIFQTGAAPSTEDNARYAARLMTTIIGDDSGSRLFWELVDTGQAEYAAISPSEYQGAGIYMSALCCAPDDTQNNFDQMMEIFAGAQADGVTEEELKQAQNKVCAQVVLHAERPASRMFAVGNGWLQRQQYRTVRETVASYRNVTVDDIRRVLDRYPLTRMSTVAIGPCKTLEV